MSGADAAVRAAADKLACDAALLMGAAPPAGSAGLAGWLASARSALPACHRVLVAADARAAAAECHLSGLPAGSAAAACCASGGFPVVRALRPLRLWNGSPAGANVSVHALHPLLAEGGGWAGAGDAPSAFSAEDGDARHQPLGGSAGADGEIGRAHV